ncbi:MAG: Na-translocating system protein MpsC family protein [Sporolactobacillus sp.]|nr:Na-translocating system protein MpsC family protein [Sporolactobacillus sp.]
MYQIYNQIGKELFGSGAVKLKIEILDDLIFFKAKHRRSPRSRILEQEVPSLQQEVDYQMSRIFKKRLRERLEIELGLSVEAVLRDYDPATPWTITNVVISDQ